MLICMFLCDAALCDFRRFSSPSLSPSSSLCWSFALRSELKRGLRAFASPSQVCATTGASVARNQPPQPVPLEVMCIQRFFVPMTSAFVCANDLSSYPLKIESWIHDFFFAFDALCAGAVAVEMDGPAKPPVPVRMN